MGDRLWAGILPQCVTSHPGQLCLLPTAVQEMSTGQSAVMLCSWGSNAEWLTPLMDKRVGGR